MDIDEKVGKINVLSANWDLAEINSKIFTQSGSIKSPSNFRIEAEGESSNKNNAQKGWFCWGY